MFQGVASTRTRRRAGRPSPTLLKLRGFGGRQAFDFPHFAVDSHPFFVSSSFSTRRRTWRAESLGFPFFGLEHPLSVGFHQEVDPLLKRSPLLEVAKREMEEILRILEDPPRKSGWWKPPSLWGEPLKDRVPFSFKRHLLGQCA